jgi:S1-C subfamily serine protease
VLIINVNPGSAAEAAGLRETQRYGNDLILGDIIQKINNQPVASFDELRNEFDKYRVGEEVTLRILRGREHISVRVKLEEVG